VKGEKTWKTLSFDVEPVAGVHALWLQFSGKGKNMYSIDWLKFE
jgi:hypothetical protein